MNITFAYKEWIPVEDRLPEENQQVLIYAGKSIYIDTFEDEGFLHDGYAEHMNIAGGNVRPVTFWMPLPKPPEIKA